LFAIAKNANDAIESINCPFQFCKKYHARFKGIEVSISQASETIKAASQAASDGSCR
jgi:hypothetical protein